MRLFSKFVIPGVDRHLNNIRATCGNPLCHNTHLMRGIPGGRPGVRVGSAWYCCVDCFVTGARLSFDKLCSRQVVEIPRHPRLSLGLYLMTRGYVTAEQLRTATAQSQALDEDLEATLARLGMATDKQLAAARSAQWGYPVLAPEQIREMVEIDIPKSVLAACKAVPLHYSATAKRILIGFAARVELRFLESVEEMTGCRADACFITPGDFEEQMERVTHPPNYEEEVIDDPGSPERMARTVGRAAVQVAAREACFSQWRNLILVRVDGKRGKTDVVFSLRTRTSVEIREISDIFRPAIAVSA
jgi:hypothetical protein